MNTRIDYLYRDGSNFKTVSAIVLAGDFTPAMVAQIRASLDEGKFFIPGQVGLPDLQNRFSPALWDPDRDHPFHELGEIVQTDCDPSLDMTVEDFAGLMAAAADDWDHGYLPPFHDEMLAAFEASCEADAEEPTI